MDQNRTECWYAEDLNPFLTGSLTEDRKKAFEEHLRQCSSCPPLIEALREDERLATLPPTPQEKRQLERIVASGRRKLRQHLEQDREARLIERNLGPQLVFWQSPVPWRTLAAVGLTILAAAGALVLWWGWLR